MKLHRFAILSATAAAALALPALAQDSNAPSGMHTYQLNAENGSHESGTVTLSPADSGSTTVTVALSGAPASAQPAHVHRGSCPKVGAIAYPLKNVVDGKSTTTVKAPLATLMGGGYAVNVHKSLTDLSTYVACTDLGPAKSSMPMGSPMPMPSSGAMHGMTPAPASSPPAH